MNAPNDTAHRKVASFEIFHTQYLDPEGRPTAEWPVWAQKPESLRELYRLMVRTRVFDKKAVSLQRTGQLGTYAACLGQEAIGAAIGHALAADDVFMPAYREYAAQFARGVPMKDVLLYWGGDERGMVYPEGTPAYHDFPLSVPIGTHVPHSIGVAYAFKLRGEKRVVLVSCGDGASSKGDFLEAVSSAKVWDLPIVFLVNNNQWAISLPRQKQTGAQTLAQKAIAGGMPGEQVDGNDAVATREVLSQAIARARNGEGPSLVEAITYRLHDHTTADDARRYRPDEEVQAAWGNCPIKRTKAYLQRSGHWSDADEQRLLAEAAAEVEAQVQAFLDTEPEPPAAIFDTLYESLPKSLVWQREEVIAAGPIGEDH
ncbi:MAG: pyruvate dehydrogenase (acetyl-transferring) E1 component subunit alpha [Gammaproteobacteria bacterium]|nr:pyruvate dehydrogenase (acetyl-transferring) E1 component subunit alpha [Gammaproteobacteria bacterium]